MPYGKEAKEELTKILQGKCLRVLVFDEDQYGRCVGDIYCNGIFVQVIVSLYIYVYIGRERDLISGKSDAGIDAKERNGMAL